jgi:ribosomal protein S18 acetylase RimI-like enzyme
MAGEVRFRAATAGDVPRIVELVNQAYDHYVERLGGPPGPMTEDYEEVVRDMTALVAERSGEIVGLLVLLTDDEGFAIHNVAVDPRHQGRGIGHALLERGESEARAAGFDSIYLYTHELMTENLALYGRVGYVEYDRRPVGGGRDLVFLRKQLG